MSAAVSASSSSSGGAGAGAGGGGGAAVQQVVEALRVLHQDPNPQAKEKANAWLAEFQKSDEAWSTAQLILSAPDAPLETKLFAAQTFRSKITYDLTNFPPAHRLPLRDSLLAALKTFAAGPRVILTQVSIALADLSLQLTADEWTDPPASMIELLGKDPAMAGALLEYLQVLSEEFSGNMKLENVRPDFGRTNTPGAGIRGSKEGEQVVQLLSMYVQAPGITTALHNQCFACLGAWLRTGLISASTLAGSPILASAFDSLTSEPLFDNAVDLLVDLIHETQELDDNVNVIQELVPRLSAMKGALLDPAVSKEQDEDGDRLRGLCRILVEAGEWYTPLILAHQDSFLPLVQNIALCVAGPHLEVARITTHFWYRLARDLRNEREDPHYLPLLKVFESLVGTIIGHLKYPGDDEEVLKGQERDDFRAFRHSIGDTLKDCCSVLGATTCLRQSVDIMSSTLSQPAIKWQDVEAPLFSMRSMGGEVDPNDEEIMPLIFDLMPRLPPHPRIRYAAILVLGRYTHWINAHPSHISFALPYVSTGLEDPDAEVSAAAAQTMKYLCKDCSHHLVPYLGQLHSFVQTVSNKLGPEDLLDIAAAIAHIIVVMPPSEAPQALSLFCMPLLEQVHDVTVSPSPATKEDLLKAGDALQRLDMLLAIVDRFPEGLPPACAGTCQQAWTILDSFLAKYGSSHAVVAEKTCIAIRRGLAFFEEEARAVAPLVLGRMAQAFEENPASGYLWITSKMVSHFATGGDATFGVALKDSFERQSAKIWTLLQGLPPNRLADVLDDYVRLLSDLVEHTPPLLFSSPAFPSAFQIAISTSTLLSPAIALGALDAIRAMITGPPEYLPSITAVLDVVAPQFVSLVVAALVGEAEDVSSNALTMCRVLAVNFPAQLAAATPAAIEALQGNEATEADKVEFMNRFNTSIAASNANQVKEAFTYLMRASKKSKERARVLQSRER